MRLARRRTQYSASQGGSPLLNLSLFLMLLSFFIILNSKSTFDESKYQPILENVRSTFASTALPTEDEAPSVTPDPIQSINEGQTIERLEALFKAQITGFEASKAGSRGVLSVSLPLEEFDRAVNSPGQIDVTRAAYSGGLQTFFVPTLISLLQSADRGAAYRMDMIFHTLDAPALLYNSDPRALDAIRVKSVEYIELLEKAGLPAHLMGIGLMKGAPDRVTLNFWPDEAAR